MDIKKLFNLIFSHKLIVTNEVTNGLPDGVLWDNNTFYIEKENGKYVVSGTNNRLLNCESKVASISSNK